MKHYPNVPHRRDIPIVWHLTFLFLRSIIRNAAIHLKTFCLTRMLPCILNLLALFLSCAHSSTTNACVTGSIEMNLYIITKYINSLRKAVCHQPNYIFTHIFTYFSIFYHNKSGNNLIFLLFEWLPDLLWSFPFFLYKIGLSQTKTYKR